MQAYRKPTFYSSYNFKKIPQVEARLSKDEIFAIEVISKILPFKTNNYIVDQLINWENVPNDPMYILNFPQREMLSEAHFKRMADAILANQSDKELDFLANQIRMQLNPHPGGQMELNVPSLNGKRIEGLQHKYAETVLSFATYAQTCHAHCTFCFRWPQFVQMDGYKFAIDEARLMLEYLKVHTEVTDVLFTGGDSLFMTADQLSIYIDAILDANLEHIRNIRFGTKTLSYWPYRFISQFDAENTLEIFQKIIRHGKHVAFMAHFNHAIELSTPIVKDALIKIRNTGAEIRSQSPVMKHINDTSDIWADLWKEQVRLGIIPYYMFVARDTGAHDYFSLPLNRTFQIFNEAYKKVSGITRSVRGPVMSAGPGKVHITGISEIMGEKVFNLTFVQGRNPDWVNKPFYAKFDEEADWLDGLKPAFGEKEFFYEKEYKKIMNEADKLLIHS